MTKLIIAITLVLCVGIAQAQDQRKELWNQVSYFHLAGDYQMAIVYMDTIIDMGVNVSKNYAYRGTLKQLAGNHQAAIVDFDKALDIDSEISEAYVKRGLAKLELEQYEAAIADFDARIGESRTLDSIAYKYRGRAYGSLGLYGNALSDYNKALTYNPRDVNLITDKASTFMALGDNEKALDLIALALKIEKNYIDASTQNSILSGSNFQNLERLLELALAYNNFHKDDAQNNLNIGYIYVKLKQSENALKYLNAVNGQLSTSYDLYYNMGMAYFYLIDNKRAIENFDKAISKQPDSGLAYIYIADCYKALGDKVHACESMERASTRGILGAQELYDANCK